MTDYSIFLGMQRCEKTHSSFFYHTLDVLQQQSVPLLDRVGLKLIQGLNVVYIFLLESPPSTREFNIIVTLPIIIIVELYSYEYVCFFVVRIQQIVRTYDSCQSYACCGQLNKGIKRKNIMRHIHRHTRPYAE